MAFDYQEASRAWTSWYVMWEDQIPKAARDALEARLGRLELAEACIEDSYLSPWRNAETGETGVLCHMCGRDGPLPEGDSGDD